MKVVHLTSVHSATDIRIYQKECICLVRAGHDVVLVAPGAEDGVYEGVQVRGVRKRRGRLARMLGTALAVYQRARDENGDVYHLHDPELLPYGQLLRARRKPVIYDMHENLPKAVYSKEWLSPTMRPLVAAATGIAERLLMRGMAVVFAAPQLEGYYPWVRDKVVVQNFPLHEPLFALKEPKYPKPTLVYVGRVAEQRGALVTLDVLRLLAQAGKPVAWECIGPGDPEFLKRLAHRAREMGLQSVRIRGHMKAEEAWNIASRAHVGLILLSPVPNYTESLPTKLLEYMALGLPVVVSDFPLLRRIVAQAQCGLCVRPDSTEEIADAVAWTLEHPAEARAMGERGRMLVREQFNWNSEAKKLLELYERIGRRHSVRRLGKVLR